MSSTYKSLPVGSLHENAAREREVVSGSLLRSGGHTPVLFLISHGSGTLFHFLSQTEVKNEIMNTVHMETYDTRHERTTNMLPAKSFGWLARGRLRISLWTVHTELHPGGHLHRSRR